MKFGNIFRHYADNSQYGIFKLYIINHFLLIITWVGSSKYVYLPVYNPTTKSPHADFKRQKLILYTVSEVFWIGLSYQA